MKFAIYVDLFAKAGTVDLGQQHFWLPAKPSGTPVQLVSYPINVPAWRITVRRLVKITITLVLRGTISVYETSE